MPPGTGKFRYIPMRIANGPRKVDLVVSIVREFVPVGNLNGEPGDVVFNLVSEWDQEENPLGDKFNEESR